MRAINPWKVNNPEEIREVLGDEGAEKVNAIIAILSIGNQRSVAYSKAILAAAKKALEFTTCFPERK